MKIVAITQARFSSSRLPGKVLLKLGSKTALDLHLKRITKSKLVNSFIVATTIESEAKEIIKISSHYGCSSYQGHMNDVLDRFYNSCKDLHPDHIVRLTSDCPLIDPLLIDDLVEKYIDSKVDYASNCMIPTLPDGMDAEIFSFKALERCWKEARKFHQREHVTPYMRDSGLFLVKSIQYPKDLSHIRMTLDTKEDLHFISSLIEACGEEASLEEYMSYLQKNPTLNDINKMHVRNANYNPDL